MTDVKPLADAARRLRENPPKGWPGKPGRPRKRPVPTAGGPPHDRRDGHTAGTGDRRQRVNGGLGDGAGAPQAPALPALAALSPRLLDLRAAALYLGLAAWSVRELEWKGVLRRVRVPLPNGGELRKVLFDRVDLDGLVDRWKSGAR